MTRPSTSLRLGLTVAASLSLAVASPPSAHAGGGPATGGATEFTQLANLAALTEQITHQVTMVSNQAEMIRHAILSYANMVDNTLSLPNQDWNDVAGQLAQLRATVTQGRALAYTLANVDDLVRMHYRTFDEYLTDPLSAEDYSTQYAEWSARNTDTIAATLESTGLNIEQFADEEATLATLRAANTNTGRTMLLQTGNQIAVQTVEQFQKLRQLTAAQTQMMASFYAKKSAIDDATTAHKELYFEPSTVVRGNGAGF